MRIEVNQQDLAKLAARHIADKLKLDPTKYSFRVGMEADPSRPPEEMISAYVTLVEK